jgi:CDP-diacylglycerol---glycerol-3-phosphate 3-phosphatidyltransferase
MHRLHRGALRTGAWHMLCLFAVAACLLKLGPVTTVLQWLLQASVVLGYVHLLLRRHLGQNHSPAGSELFPTLGVANGITLGRGWGVSCLSGLIFLPHPTIDGKALWVEWLPGLLYLAIGCADFVDGLWARRTRSESLLGRRLDVEMDALGLLAASSLGVWMGRLPLFYLMVGVSYYLFRLGIRYRRSRGRTVLPLKDRPMARITAGLNMGFVGFALLPVIAEGVLNLAALFFAVPLLGGFVWDWLAVSARLSDDAAQRLERVMATAAGRASLLTRLALLGCGPLIAATISPSLENAASLIGSLLWVMMVLGWLGRAAALGAGFWLAHAASSGHAEPVFLVALSACLVLMILGTGPWSLWKPEDACLSCKAGTRPAVSNGSTAGVRGFNGS